MFNIKLIWLIASAFALSVSVILGNGMAICLAISNLFSVFLLTIQESKE